MMSNIKKQCDDQHLNNSQQSHPLYLGEVKRFITYYSTCLYYQKVIPEEQNKMKEKLNRLYQDMLLVKDSSLMMELFDALIWNINPTILSSLWKASIKTLIKLLSYPDVVSNLAQNPSLDCNKLIQVFLEAKIEPIDQSEEEQKLLLKQKMLIKIIQTFRVNDSAHMTVFNYILSVAKKKTVDDIDQYYSMQFSDAVKKNLHKLLSHFMQGENFESVKDQVFDRLFTKIKKYMVRNNTLSNSKVKEYTCFLIKTLEDCLKKCSQQEYLSNLITFSKKDLLIETICMGAECEDIMVRNQAQQLFTFVLTVILEQNLPLREELEILLVKVVLKPALTLAKKLNAESVIMPAKKLGGSSPGPAAEGSSSKSGSSNASIGGVTLNDSDYENEDFIQVSSHERTVQEDVLLEMNMNFLLETLLLLRPEQLSSLFLLYDCQPFSENFITKSIIMLLKYAAQSKDLYFRVYRCLLRLFDSPSNEKNVSTTTNTINMMLEQKAQTRRFAKDLNIKFKNFLTKVDDLYSYMDKETPADVASKMLAYSREVKISNVIEVIGGKDDRAKRIMESFLAKIVNDGSSNIELAMRRFLQTFRLAGVDSQVVSRIIERFSHRFHDIDQKSVFLTKVESFDFAYLIIVLQTSQHNPNIKSKIDLKSFIEQALINCPLSKDQLPNNYFENIYSSVTDIPFFSPISRSLIDEGYNQYNQTEVAIRLTSDSNREITESEFINSADLTNKQLFNYSNTIQVPPSLLPLASKHLLSILSHRFIRYVLSTQQQNSNEQFDLLHSLITLNKQQGNLDIVDRVFQVLYKVVIATGNNEVQRRQLDELLWVNFDCLRRSLVLLPKMSMGNLMKEEVRTGLTEAMLSVKRLIKLKYQEKRYSKKQEATITQDDKAKHQAPAKTPSFFDLVYNYFTENADQEDAREQERKDEAFELKAMGEIRKKLLDREVEGDYQECIEEKFDDKVGQQWIKEKSRLQELIALICTQIRENQNQEEGTLCLAFLDHLLRKADHPVETLEKLWIETHLLMVNCLKSKQQNNENQNSGSKDEVNNSKGEYEIISTDTSQDSMESQNIDLNMDVFAKESCPIKTRIFDATNRHLILQLHLTLSKQVIAKNTDRNTNHIIREVQRVISQVIETGDAMSPELYRLFDEGFFYDTLQEFFQGLSPIALKQYPKLSKLLRLTLILILKSQTRSVGPNHDSIIGEDETNMLLQKQQLTFFKTVTQLLLDLSPLLPYDLINLALDVFQKLPLPRQVKERDTLIQLTMESSISVLDNLTYALQKQSSHVPEDTKREIWFRIIQIIQDKLLMNPSCHAYIGLTQQVFNVIKNAVLSHPFEIDHQLHFTLVRKLFADILFHQTFENLSAVSNGKDISHREDEEEELKEVSENLRKTEQEVLSDDDSGDSAYRLEQMCIIAVNNLTDVFIYYIAGVFKDEGISTSDQSLFAYLWLNLLRVLLHYAEQGHAHDLHGLVVCSHDNIKRVIEFLIQCHIFKADEDEQSESEMGKLWKSSWDIIGAFFADMKASVLNKDN